MKKGLAFRPTCSAAWCTSAVWPLRTHCLIEDANGAVFGTELERIGYAGPAPLPGPAPHAFVELHIEQGPVLEDEDVTIGVVEGVQGISWTELTLTESHATRGPLRCVSVMTRVRRGAHLSSGARAHQRVR